MLVLFVQNNNLICNALLKSYLIVVEACRCRAVIVAVFIADCVGTDPVTRCQLTGAAEHTVAMSSVMR